MTRLRRLWRRVRGQKTRENVVISHAFFFSVAKLAKVESIKFSGEYRDFAHFKKTFQTIVYPNRDPVEIGLRLLEAVPEKHRHLIDNINPEKYTEIMSKLEERVGRAWHIVSSCTNEIAGLSKPKSDEEYILFVEKFE